MNKLVLVFVLLMGAGCTHISFLQSFQKRFEKMPIGTTPEQIRNEFGTANLFKDMSEDNFSFRSLIAYRRHGFLCTNYFEDGKTFSNGVCVIDNEKIEFREDTNEYARPFAPVYVRINNTKPEPVCSSFKDMFKVVRTTCD